MATDNRKSRRVKFERGINGWIMAIDGTWRRKCVMEDASQNGARLIVGEDVAKLGSTEFFLLLSSTGLVYRRCLLIWVNGEEIGVEFVRGVKNSAKAPAARQSA
jgi:hypothetical protein